LKRNFLTTLTVFIIIISFFVFTGCKSTSDDFTLMDLDGNEVSLSDFNGKVLILNFWATWCPYCREEIPDFVEVYNEYESEDVQFIGVSNEDISTLRSFVEDYNISYPILIDDANIMGEWEISALPTTFVFDKDGQIISKSVGMMTREQLVNIIEDAL
jgi:peroxiredoxin